jgi:uncharacterized BrkB/YihY/UPF0761 family membrane protein
VLPVKSQNVSDAIHNIATPASAAGLISLIVLVWAASGMMAAIRSSLERTMGIGDDRGIIRGKLLDIMLVAATAVLVLTSVGIGLVTQFVDGIVAGLADAVGLHGTVAKAVVSKLLPLLLWTATLLLVYRVVPAKRPRFADALAGAVVTAVLLLALSRCRLPVLARDEMELDLRLADERLRVPVFGLSVWIGDAVRCGVRDGVVTTSPARSRTPGG